MYRLKHKVYFVLFMSLVFCLAVFGNCFAENLLGNAGFENDLNVWNQIGENWQAQTLVVHTGAKSAEQTLPDYLNIAGYSGFVTQLFNFAPGQTIYATLYAKTDYSPSAQATAGLRVAFLDSDYQIIESHQDSIGGQTDWKQLYVFATAPAGTVKVAFYAFTFAEEGDLSAIGGLAYFDDAVMTTDPIAPPGYDLVNPGFENELNVWDVVEPQLVEEEPPLPATWGLEESNPYAGIYSARNIIDTENLNAEATEYFAAVKQEFYTMPGTVFYATGYAKTAIDPVSSAKAGIAIDFFNSAGQLLVDPDTGESLGESDVIGGQTDWKNLYVAVEAPAETVKVRFSFFVFTEKDDTLAQGGIALFDQAVFGTDPIAPPVGYDLGSPGFENGLHAWDVVEPYLNIGSDLTWTLETDDPYAGIYSAKNIIDTENLNTQATDYFAATKQEFFAEEGQTFYATGYAKTAIDPVSNAKAGIAIDFLNASGNVLINPVTGKSYGDSDVVGGQTDWRSLYVMATAPDDTVKVRYSFIVWAQKNDALAQGGIALFDQAVFGADYIAPPAAPAELRNPDFENGLHDWDVTDAYLNPQPSGGPYPSTWVAQDSQVFSGALAAKNTINMDLHPNAQSYYVALNQDFVVEPGGALGPGDLVYATAWAKTIFNNGSFAVAGLKLSALDSAGAELDFFQDNISGINDWSQLNVSLVCPENTEKIRYTLFVWASKTNPAAEGGIVYFDNAFMAFPYINHLGMVEGQDLFPQETAVNYYQTGSASARAAIRYLTGNSPSQNELYYTYHWSGPGNDMLPGEIMTALNEEVGFPYNFTDWYQTDNQTDAIANFVYWVDFLPSGGNYCPAQVPVSGDLNWRTVRGISTDIKPHPIGEPMPDFTVYALWINDPVFEGLGFNVFQTIDSFQSDYLPLSNGKYRAVYEPPKNLDVEAFAKELENAKIALAPAEPNPELKDALSEQKTICGDSTSCVLSLQVAAITPSLPKELKTDAIFSNLLTRINSTRVFDVYWKDKNKSYTILALSSKTLDVPDGSKGGYTLAPKEASILLEVDPQNGACKQATWVEQEESYPKLSEQEAIAAAQGYLSNQAYIEKTAFYRNVVVKTNSTSSVKSIRLVWSRTFKTSRFHPSYEISFYDGKKVYVHPNGSVQLVGEGAIAPAPSVER